MSDALPVVLAATGRAVEARLAEASAWFERVGAGDHAPRFTIVGEASVEPLGRFAALGGLDVHPHNSQALVELLLTQLDLRAATRLVVVVPPHTLRPHCWQLPASRRRAGKLERYAILPSDATLGAVAHELGHLAFDWPDLATDSGLGHDCLMAHGALLADPAPPNAVLRLRAGWLDARAPERSLAVGELAIGEAIAIGDRVIERRERPDRVLVLLDRARPRLLRRIPLRPEDLARPLLALARFGG